MPCPLTVTSLPAAPPSNSSVVATFTNPAMESSFALLIAPRRFDETHRHVHVAAIAHNFNIDRIADLVFVESTVQVIGVPNFLAINADDNVTQLDVAFFGLRQAVQSGVGRRAARQH